MNASDIRPFLSDIRSYLRDAEHEAGFLALNAQKDFEPHAKLNGYLYGIRDALETIDRILRLATKAANEAEAKADDPSPASDPAASVHLPTTKLHEDARRSVREAKAYLDGAAEKFLVVMMDNQAESDEGDRLESLAALAGTIEAARIEVANAHEQLGGES